MPDAPSAASAPDGDGAAAVVSAAGPTCACGHDRDHFMVSPEPSYSTWGWFWLLFGSSVVPARVDFKCRQCGQVFDRTQDVAEMKRYTF
ncbi:MAG: hypothetical protein H6742_20795 [Alphaproteobacteria bacterium]|nr:hypothetical protein [Alphaproteobacteria bacterium]